MEGFFPYLNRVHILGLSRYLSFTALELEKLHETQTMRKLTEYHEYFDCSAKREYSITSYVRRWTLPEFVLVLRIDDYVSDEEDLFWEEMHLYDLFRVTLSKLIVWFRSYDF